MVQYFDNKDLACFDGYSFRLDKKTGYYLSTKKIGARRKRLHVHVWEKFNGPVPAGYHVHHKDGDKSNNTIENMELLTSSEHAKHHGENLTEEQKIKLAENLAKNARPKAFEWHGSEAGRAWHSQHGKDTWKDKQPIEYTCTYCGKKFMSMNRYAKNWNTFCSNNCKSAYRRASGVDDVTKICEICGKEYTANKYAITKRCQDCKDNHRGFRRRRACV